MKDFQTKRPEPASGPPQHAEPTLAATAVDSAQVNRMASAPLQKSPPAPDYRAIVHGFDKLVPLIQQGDLGTINGVAAQVIAHVRDTPVVGVFDFFVMPEEMPPWWPSLPHANTPVGPHTSAGTAVLIDRALFLVTGYRTYAYYSLAKSHAMQEWSVEAHKQSPDPKRLDELERPLRHIRFMQKTLDKLAHQVFEESR